MGTFQDSEEYQCHSAASMLVQTVTYRKMFEPILEGEYTIRSHEKYLAAVSSDELGIVDKEEKTSVWEVFKEEKDSEVQYKIFNKKYSSAELKFTEGKGDFGGLEIAGSENPPLQFTSYGITIMTGAG